VTNGTAITLTAGDHSAVVTSVGATLAALRFRGVDLVYPLDLTRLPLAYEGKALAPWPNRIRDGRYAWDGVPLQVPITEVGTGNALHGLASWLDWDVVDVRADAVTLRTTVAAQPGYPFTLDLEARYVLSGEGLAVRLTARNAGGTPAPVGLGFHPYLRAGGSIDDLTLFFRAAAVLDVDDRGLPVGRRDVAGTAVDFAEPRPIAALAMDNPFAMPPFWRVELRDAGGAGVALESDAPWLHLYTGELLGRRALAVEPTTCPPDAFNSGEDLAVPAPGEIVALEFRITALAR